jgi:dolichol-phosphate mannosyltransferase
MDMKTYIIIPTYNESENIAMLVENIFSIDAGYRVIIVDDNSPDGTGEIADKLSEKFPFLEVIHRPDKTGLGRAYIDGFKKALTDGADFIFEMDGDLSHDPKYLYDFKEAIGRSDIVIGSRYSGPGSVEGWSFWRFFLSKISNIYVSILMVKPVTDFTSGFRCYRRRAIEILDPDKIISHGYAFQIEMTYLAFKNGLRIEEIPIHFKERIGGYSKFSWEILWEAFWLTLGFRAPFMDITRNLFSLFISAACRGHRRFDRQ